ncbi:MAG: nucleotidyltransferase [Gammaproteobacteria bacterium]|nr:nucleotidyltransferase [Gammaproteobacteria bacterium]
MKSPAPPRDPVPSIEPLRRAVQRLEEGLARHLEDTFDAQIRDGLVQRFEFTYEQSHKTLKRYLEYASPNPGQFDEMTFQDLIRTANEQGLLLGDWPDWREFREMRGATSHAYDEEVALKVVQCIPRFLEEAAHLHDRLRERLA